MRKLLLITLLSSLSSLTFAGGDSPTGPSGSFDGLVTISPAQITQALGLGAIGSTQGLNAATTAQLQTIVSAAIAGAPPAVQNAIRSNARTVQGDSTAVAALASILGVTVAQAQTIADEAAGAAEDV